MNGVLKKRCGIQCGVAATRILSVLSLYEHTHGELPGKLDELVPDYLTAVPCDPYDGERFRYASDRARIHVVGEDAVYFLRSESEAKIVGE